MQLQKRTAVLVIHGVGQHMPFQACDSFMRGFCDVFMNVEELKKKKPKIEAQHKIKQRQDWLGVGIPWIQNYVSLPVPEKGITVDFYEYFWDIYMVHEVRFCEAYKLLIKASEGARDFYRKHPDLLPKATDLGEFGRKTKFGTGKMEFRPAGYLKLLGPFFTFIATVLPYLPRAIKLLDWLAGTQIPILKQIVGAFSVFMKEAAPDSIGDLVRYLDLDPRSERFETRRRIINGALEELRALIKDDRYDQIIIAGHSLGSVIAYDALNRVIQEINAEKIIGDEAKDRVNQEANVKWITEDEASKITGLVTFGSPLDKIACFFRQRIKDDKEVQRQVLANLHGFRARSLEKDKKDKFANKDDKLEGTLEIIIDTPMKFKLNKTRWLNFYHNQDLISGRLDLYDLKNQPFQHLEIKDNDGNIRIKEDFGKSLAHVCYLGEHRGKGKGTNEMYQVIIKEFFQ